MSNSTKGAQKKEKRNLGGRPRTKAGSLGSKTSMVQWKDIVEPAGSINQYQISNRGEVRRLLKSGRYKPVKAWVTGGVYAAVYLYGFKSATRHRKKVYIHRLVASHFVKGRKKLEVVHHKAGPANNTAGQLEWVSVADNLKARKYLDPETAKPKKRSVKKPKPKKGGKKVVKDNVPPSNALKDKRVHAPPQAEEKSEPKPRKLPKPDNFPDKDEWIPNVETLQQKIKYLAKNSKEFRTAYMRCRAVVKELKAGNLAELHKRATGKGIKLDDKRSPLQWKVKLISALHAIQTRLKQ